MGAHDVSYRILFSHRTLVESLIRGFLPAEWSEGLDFSTLEPVSEAHGTQDWSLRFNDCVWRLRWREDGRWVYVYLMLEFQSTDETFMAVRILSYVGLLYEHLVKALSLRSDDTLPLVVPVVIYNGESPWSAATELFDLMAPAPPGMAEVLPRLRYIVLDARHMPLAELDEMRNVIASLFRLEASPDLESSRAAIGDLDELLHRPEHVSLRRDFTRWLCKVLLPLRLPGVTVPEARRLEEVKSMLTENTLDWTAEWRMKGLEEGLERGRQEGRREGEAALLLRQIERKFGLLEPRDRRRIQDADAERLLEWGERLMTVESLPEVFGDSSKRS